MLELGIYAVATVVGKVFLRYFSCAIYLCLFLLWRWVFSVETMATLQEHKKILRSLFRRKFSSFTTTILTTIIKITSFIPRFHMKSPLYIELKMTPSYFTSI